MSAPQSAEIDVAATVAAWEQAVHESYCGTPPSCGVKRGCEGLPSKREKDALRRVLRSAPTRVTPPESSGS